MSGHWELDHCRRPRSPKSGVAVATALAMTLAYFALLLWVARSSLERLRQLPPLSVAVVAEAWAFALLVTMATVLLLAALAVVLAWGD